jgi:hypothetical protein
MYACMYISSELACTAVRWRCSTKKRPASGTSGSGSVSCAHACESRVKVTACESRVKLTERVVGGGTCVARDPLDLDFGFDLWMPD